MIIDACQEKFIKYMINAFYKANDIILESKQSQQQSKFIS